ncbi:hypothetical protein [Lacrimispora sphenoides]|nr:hypothetical protein [Lacrimispora sphenoides]
MPRKHGRERGKEMPFDSPVRTDLVSYGISFLFLIKQKNTKVYFINQVP